MSQKRAVRRAADRRLQKQWKKNRRKVDMLTAELSARGGPANEVVVSFDFPGGPDGISMADLADPTTGRVDFDTALAHAVDVHVRVE